MKRRALIIVDMQNDFVTGSLANPAAANIIPDIAEFAKHFDGDLLATMDTHYSGVYEASQEGKKLPVLHCQHEQHGWFIVDELKGLDYKEVFCKFCFGSSKLANYVYQAGYDEVLLCGTCTDICVISNAIMIRNIAPEVEVKVLSDLCAGTTEANHLNAMKAMSQCQITITESISEGGSNNV